MSMSISIDSHLAVPRFSASLSFSSSSSNPTKSLEPKTLTLRCLHHRPSLSKPILGFSLSHPSPTTINGRWSIHRRSTFRSSLSPQESAPSTNYEKVGKQKDEEASNGEGDQKYPTDVKTIIRFYQEALSNGDEKTASEIEAIICSIEKEKNRLDLKVLSLSTEITSSKEKYIRLQADFDNFRKKFEKDRLTTQSNARGELLESLLSMVDSFERLRQQMKPETEKEKKIDTSYQGIYKQFVEVLRSLQVAAMATVGKPFDPLLHEAIAREESQEFKDGIVIEELHRGFLLGDRVLRQAKVKVSSGPGHKKTPLATELSSSEQPAKPA